MKFILITLLFLNSYESCSAAQSDVVIWKYDRENPNLCPAVLREISQNITFPLSEEDKKDIETLKKKFLE